MAKWLLFGLVGGVMLRQGAASGAEFDAAACGAVMQRAGACLESGIADAFVALGFPAALSAPQTAEDVAHARTLHAEATRRFLNAVVGIGLASRAADGRYAATGTASPSVETSELLFWMVRHRVGDLLVTGLSEAELAKTVPETARWISPAVREGFVRRDGDVLRLEAAYVPFLSSGGAYYLGPVLVHFEHVMRPMFTPKGFEGALRTGKAQWHAIYGNAVNNPFDRLGQLDPNLFGTFMRGMHLLNLASDAELAAEWDLRGVKSILDVGGASGALVSRLLAANAAIERADVYELPETVGLLQSIFREYAPVETRVRYVEGDFLADGQKGLKGLAADALYDRAVLAWILHDWDDATAAKILRRVFEHVKPGGRVGVVEIVLDEDRLGPRSALRLDMAMLLQTEGRERTFDEYKRLLEAAGFVDVRIATRTSRRNVVEARRP